MPKKAISSKDTELMKNEHWFSVCEANEDAVSISENEGCVHVIFASLDNSDEVKYSLIL